MHTVAINLIVCRPINIMNESIYYICIVTIKSNNINISTIDCDATMSGNTIT